jgi:hypothetical protein
MALCDDHPVPVARTHPTMIPEETMKHLRLITTAIALSIAATGLSAINAAQAQAEI